MLHHSQSGIRLRRDSDGEVTAMLRRGHWCCSLPCCTCRWVKRKAKDDSLPHHQYNGHHSHHSHHYSPLGVDAVPMSSRDASLAARCCQLTKWAGSEAWRHSDPKCKMIVLIIIAFMGWYWLHVWSHVRQNTPGLTFTLGGIDIDSIQLVPFDDTLLQQYDEYRTLARQIHDSQPLPPRPSSLSGASAAITTNSQTSDSNIPATNGHSKSDSSTSSDGNVEPSSSSSTPQSSSPSMSSSPVIVGSSRPSRSSHHTSGSGSNSDSSSNSNGNTNVPLSLPPFNHPNHMFTTRIVHIDMKGLPPRASWLASIMPWMAQRGATGILLEWEDMLPYYDELAVLRSPNAYTPSEVAMVLDAAYANGLSVIPLVPTFGNLEFVLKHRQFAFLREVPSDLRAVCPTQAKSSPLLIQLLTQVISFHPRATMVHLGGNEIGVVKQCGICQRVSLAAPDLYLFHIKRVIDHARDTLKLKVLMYDDMVRDWSLDALELLSETGIQLVVWNHTPDLRGNPPILRNYLWGNYDSQFKGRIWAGSAYRGADAIDGDFVPIQSRAWNHQSWLRLAMTQAPFQGIIIGGLARRSHLNPLTESLPASLPSLAVSLAVLQYGYYNAHILNITLQDLGIPAGAPIGGPSSLADLQHSVTTVALAPLAGGTSPAISFEHTRVDEASLPRAHVRYAFPGSMIYRWVEHLQAVKTLQRDALERTLREGNPIGGTPGVDANELVKGSLHGRKPGDRTGIGNGEDEQQDTTIGWGVGYLYAGAKEEAKALSNAIHGVVLSAETLLPTIFFDNDIEELIATKLGVDMADAVEWDIPQSAAPRCDDPTKPTAANASRFFAFLVAIGLAQYCY